MFKTISENVSSEIVEKKSKFIANIFYVESVEEAEEKIKEIKKKYYDARHNCFAFSVYTEDGNIDRFSDDGEPSGTAGSPMLAILKAQNLSNILVVVTRYFGGILLGTGGLTRAYSSAAINAIEKGNLIKKEPKKSFPQALLKFSYSLGSIFSNFKSETLILTLILSSDLRLSNFSKS